MKRYWASWYSGYYEDEGCTKPPFEVWITGQVDRAGDTDRDDYTICAEIDAENEDAIWEIVKKHFPDYRYRFCEERELGWEPDSGRFPKN